MKKSGGKFNNIAKYFIAIVAVIATVFGLTNSQTIGTFVRNYFSAGQEPAHEKNITDKGEQDDERRDSCSPD